MNLFELFVKIGVDDQASGKIATLSSKLGKGLATAAKVGTAAIGAASAAIVALGKIGLDYNTQMETYTTNFEVMMGDAEAAAKKVEELKEMGARTPFELGNLANATQTLLAFNVSADDSTGVLEKLGDISLGNVQKLESLTRAYGKMNASQKVTLEDINMMIDAGFNPLLIVAEQTGKTMTEVYDDISKGKVSFEQITDAINTATSAGGQFYQGMAKASQTTEGLISTLKDNATALVGEVYQPISEGLTSTVLPAAIDAIGKLTEAFRADGVEGMIVAAGEMLGSLVNTIVEYAPKVVETAVSLVEALVQGLSENQESIATGAVQIITTLATGILNMLPQIVQLGLDLIVSLANGIAESLPELIPSIIDVILQIINTLTAPEQLNQLSDAAIMLVFGIMEGLLSDESIDGLTDAVFALIDNIITFLTNPENIIKFVETGVKLVVSLAEGIFKMRDKMREKAVELVKNFIDKFKETDWRQIGRDIVNGVWNGIKSMVSLFTRNVQNFFSNIVSGVKSVLGIRSPSKVFAEIGSFMAEGLSVGWDKEFGKIQKSITDDMDFGMASVDFTSSGLAQNNNKIASAMSSVLATANDTATIIVQSVLDGKIIGETATKYQRRTERAFA